MPYWKSYLPFVIIQIFRSTSKNRTKSSIVRLFCSPFTYSRSMSYISPYTVMMTEFLSRMLVKSTLTRPLISVSTIKWPFPFFSTRRSVTLAMWFFLTCKQYVLSKLNGPEYRTIDSDASSFCKKKKNQPLSSLKLFWDVMTDCY